MSDLFPVRTLALALLALTASACGGTSGPTTPGPIPPGPVTPGQPAPTAPTPHTVKGVVLNERGAPVENADIIVEPAMFRGTVFTTTNAAGTYRSIALPAQANPYFVYAYKKLTYHGKPYCVRMAGEGHAYQDAFNATPGVIRNFRWKLTGASDMSADSSGSEHWGASLAFDNTSTEDDMFVDWDARIEVTLLPDGPLIDGSEGRPLTLITTVAAGLQDIPAGYYRLSATLIRDDGSRAPLQVSTSNLESRLAGSTALLFNGYETCGHAGTFQKTFVWLARQ